MILTGWSGRSFCSMSHKDSPQVVEKETQSKSELVVCRYTRQSANLVEPVEVCKSNVHLPGFPLSWSPVATGSAKKTKPNNTAPITTHHYTASVSIPPLAKTVVFCSTCAQPHSFPPLSSAGALNQRVKHVGVLQTWQVYLGSLSLGLWPFPFPLFTATSTAVCPTVTTHTHTHTHKYQFTEEGSRGQASAGTRALWLS